ncbi:MAG: hypothetical protein ABIN58_11530 [candidate division WOR-3 bacterium]
MIKGLSSVFLSLLVTFSVPPVSKAPALAEGWRINIESTGNFFSPFLGLDGKLYLLEVATRSRRLTGPGRLTVLDSSGRKIREFESELLRGSAIGIDANGNIYIPRIEGTGTARHSVIRVVGPDFTPLRTIETGEVTPDQVLLDSRGQIYLVGLRGKEKDKLDGKIIHIYSPEGRHINSFGQWDETLPIDQRILAVQLSSLAIDETHQRLVVCGQNQFSPEVYDFNGRLKFKVEPDTATEAGAAPARPEVIVNGMQLLGDRLVASVWQVGAAGSGRKGYLYLFDAQMKSLEEVEVPTKMGSLIGVDKQGNLYFYVRGPQRQIVKARLVER